MSSYRRRKPVAVTVPPREFIEAWQGSESVAEVAQKVRSNKNACRVRGYRFRERGVPLKDIPTSPPYEPPDWDELAEYAESLLGQELADDGLLAGLGNDGDGGGGDEVAAPESHG
jgi:hypothetical protein